MSFIPFLIAFGAAGVGSLGTYLWTTSSNQEIIDPQITKSMTKIVDDLKNFDVKNLKHVELKEPSLVFTTSDLLIHELNSPHVLKITPIITRPKKYESEFFIQLKNRFKVLNTNE
jgi:hypothetical protein